MNKKLILIASLCLLLSIQVFSQSRKEYHIPGHENVEAGIGYTHAVKVGNILYISGTVNGQSEDMKSQMEKIYEYVDATLEHYGVNTSAIVKENIYTTDIDEFKQHIPIRKAFYKENVYPTSTWVQVERLFIPQLKVEMEFMAVVE